MVQELSRKGARGARASSAKIGSFSGKVKKSLDYFQRKQGDFSGAGVVKPYGRTMFAGLSGAGGLPAGAGRG
jgi:hypothetical protein